MQKGNTIAIVLVVVAILLIGGGVAYVLTQSQENQTTTSEQMTVEEPETQDTMMEDQQPTGATGQATMEENAAVKTFNVSGRNFAFTPNEITVQKGDTVKIVFTAQAGMHDFVIDEFNARTDIVSTGQTSEVTFVADEAGEFEYYCSVGNHRQQGMVGTLIVEE